ncbi:MAG: VCBS repeat-containing protein [Deltaproteobacteria bacterium]|nr:VCBS repeat-containing protein [Deltaproteobacteria bacterium]
MVLGLLLCLVPQWACSPADVDDQTSAPPATPDITLAVTEPATGNKAPVLGNTFTLKVSAKAPKGTKVTTVKATYPNGTVVPLTGAGESWSAVLDTTKMLAVASPEKACGKKASVDIAATGTGGAAGSTVFDIDVDHCGPVLEMVSPKKPGPGEASPVFIGWVPLELKISDPKLAKAQLFASTDAEPTPVQLGEDMTRTGTYIGLLDRTKYDSATLHLQLKAVDQAGNQSELVRDVSVLRQPSFLGNSDDNDLYDLPIDDVVALDFDGDTILDEVIGGEFGIIVRRGLPVAGKPTQPSLTFEPIEALNYNNLALVDTFQDKEITVSRLLPTHILTKNSAGQPANLDLLAAGTWDAKPALIALVLAAQPDSKTGKFRYGYRPIQVHVVPEAIKAAELGDLDADGLPDVIAAMGTDNTGLLTVLVQKNPTCYLGKTPKPCIEADPLKITDSNVFRQGDHQPLHKGVAAISSIAVGDFFADQEKLMDVCVGDANRPYITCYENTSKDGSLHQGEDGFFSADTGDTNLILKVEFTSPNGADGPDLIYASKNGTVRWIKGMPNGTFSFDPASKNYRTILDFDATDLRVANVGPTGLPWLVMVSGGRQVTTVPIAVADNAMDDECFRSWVMGGAVKKTLVDDFNSDGTLDIMALNQLPYGTPVYAGVGAGDFRAPRVHHMCYVAKGQKKKNLVRFGVAPIVQATAVDLQNDGKPDILAVGELADSAMPEPGDGNCGIDVPSPKYFPIWPWHAWMNASGLPSFMPRATEFNPNYSKFHAEAGVKTDCNTTNGNAPQVFGSPRRFAVGDLDGDKLPDVAIIRKDANYYVGDKDPSTDKCAECKKFKTSNEFKNDYGDEGKEGDSCCHYYAVSDTDKQTPLVGFGGGAPLPRASLFIHLSKKKDAPLGMDPASRSYAPKPIGANFAQAAGVEPLAVVIGDLNNDKKNDVAVAMDEFGSKGGEASMSARLRIYLGNGAGGIKHADQKGDFRDILADGLIWVGKEPVEYRRLYGTPIALLAASYGAKGLLGLFAVEKGADAVDALMSMGSGADFSPAKQIPAGSGLIGCSARDVNGDLMTDLLCSSSNAVGYLKALGVGGGDSFEAKVNLVENAPPLLGVEIGDVNHDGKMDLIGLDGDLGIVRFYLGDGNNGFAAYSGQLRPLAEVMAIQSVDFDVDGCVDLMVTSKMGVTVLRNLACDKLN